LKVVVEYPTREEEALILERMANTRRAPSAREVVSLAQVQEARGLVDRVALDPRLAQYLVDLVFATREPAAAGLPELVSRIQYGGSPRATIWLALSARAHALVSGRGYVTPTDIKRVAVEVLRHRVVPSYEAEAEGLDADALVARVLETVPVP
jgi:MoxR-like ATPase